MASGRLRPRFHHIDGITFPPDRLWVFSQTISLMRGKKPAVDIAWSIISGLIRPSGGIDRPESHSRQGRGGASLDVPRVDPGIAQDIVAGAGLEHDRQLVAHGSGGDENGGFLADHRRRLLLEGIGGGIVGVDVVADLGLGHGLAHLVGGPGDRVGSEIGNSVRERHALEG